MHRPATPRRFGPMQPWLHWSMWLPALTYGLAEWLALTRSRARDRLAGQATGRPHAPPQA
jgi:hypothetical protein